MNYLAHCYLSGNNDELLIGNFIADHVKGNMIDGFSESIKSGIFLHRAIDEFTDQHPIVAQSKLKLRTEFRKYAPVIVDVFYDHFLARDWEQYHHLALNDFAQNVYSLLENNNSILPERTKYMLNYMKAQNWLVGYAQIEGMEKALSGLARRTNFESKMEFAHIALKENYNDFEKEFSAFFEELRLFVSTITLK